MYRAKGYISSVLVILCFIIGAWAAHAQTHTEWKSEASLQLLLPISNQALDAKQHILIKHTSPYTSYRNQDDFLHTGQEISLHLGLPKRSELTLDHDRLLYKAEAVSPNDLLTTLLWIGYPDGTTDLILTAQTKEGTATENFQNSMVQLQQVLSQKLQTLNIKPQWNVIIQGSLSDTFADSEQGQISVYQWLENQLQLQEVGRYQDKGSLSVSYYSPMIEDSLAHEESGTQKMNFQVAVHQNSITHERRITLGTPAISVEY